MHDNPAIYPTLPPRAPDRDSFEAMVGPVRGTPWQTCWEYVMTHDLSESERAAFWTGANLAYQAAES